MKPHTPNNRNSTYDIESRKKGPFSVFLFSYQLPPEPTEWIHPHAQHQALMEKQRERKALAREWHRNPNRRRSVPAILMV